MALWLVAGLALLVALAALSAARRLSRKLDSLNQSYWELRYDYTRLRSQVARLDPDQVKEAEAAAAASAAPPSVSFVPLSAIKARKAADGEVTDKPPSTTDGRAGISES